MRDGVVTRRPSPFPGPRCTTHHRAFRKSRKERAHAARVEDDFGISGETYWAIYEAQGRVCAICQRATGAARRLAVDHDHSCRAGHPPDQGCPRCVRGLLCSVCNYQLLGRLDREGLRRALEYLDDPPARRVLAG